MKAEKQDVLRGAAALFIERGYTRTSMRDIAEKCRISKATLYQMFRSKEELGIAVDLFLTARMVEKVESIMERGELFPQETLKKSLLVRMEQFSERERLLEEVLVSLPREQREQHLPTILRNRLPVFRLFITLVMRTFGIGSETLASELTFTLNGLMRESMFLIEKGNLELDKSAACDFIIDALEAVLEKRRGKEPLLSQQQLQLLKEIAREDEADLASALQRKRLVRSLKSAVEDYGEKKSFSSLQEAEVLIARLKEMEEK